MQHQTDQLHHKAAFDAEYVETESLQFTPNI
ncbi:hypothetical protein T09_12138 [Trichinella sp. T9]|nr:hypothetical protein T09_12138 [Trichinella sp. T9]